MLKWTQYPKSLAESDGPLCWFRCILGLMERPGHSIHIPLSEGEAVSLHRWREAHSGYAQARGQSNEGEEGGESSAYETKTKQSDAAKQGINPRPVKILWPVTCPAQIEPLTVGR